MKKRLVILTVVALLGFGGPASAHQRLHRWSVGTLVIAQNPLQTVYIAFRQVDRSYYAQWECTLGGGVVGAGIFWVGLTTPFAIGAIIGGSAFTAGCEVGAPHRPDLYYMNGVPWEHNNLCWMVFPHHDYTRRFLECAV
jgi:hypothetical protein